MTTIIVWGDVNIGRRRREEQRMSRTARDIDSSVIDDAIHRQQLAPALEGASYASAGRMEWVRELAETHDDFIARCRAEAAEAGYETLSVRAYVSV